MTAAMETANLHGFEVHPVADLFPLIEGADFAALVKDIGDNGLMEDVTVDMEGRLIDGRNRVRACHEAGVEVRIREYDGADVTSFVVSLNMARRHLTDSQRAMIAAGIANLSRGNASGANQYQSGNLSSEIFPSTPTQTQVREQMQVSTGSMGRARRIINQGTPELAGLTKSGAVPLTTGARVAQLPVEDQDEFVAQVKAGTKPIGLAPPDGRNNVMTPIAPRPKSPSKYGGNRRKHLGQLDALINAFEGYDVMLRSIKDSGLDSSVDKEQAARILDGLNEATRSLNRINTLLKERSK